MLIFYYLFSYSGSGVPELISIHFLVRIHWQVCLGWVLSPGFNHRVPQNHVHRQFGWIGWIEGVGWIENTALGGCQAPYKCFSWRKVSPLRSCLTGQGLRIV